MAAQRPPDGIPVYLVTPTWCLVHKSIQFPSEQMETSNIHLRWHSMKFQSMLTPLPKDHHLVFVLYLPSQSFNWYPQNFVLKACKHSFCSHLLPGTQFQRHLLYTLCHLFVSLEDSYSILSFLTGKLLYNSRSYPSLFPEPCHAALFVHNIPQAMCGGCIFWYNDIFYHAVSSLISNHVFASFYHNWTRSWCFYEASI